MAVKLILSVLVVASSRTWASTCPGKEVLEDTSVAPVVRQVDSEHIEVDWSLVWPDVDWSECFSSGVIVINDNHVTDMEDLSAKVQTLQTEPCQEIRAELEVTMTDTNDDLKTLASERDFKIFKPPKGKLLDTENQVYISYKQGWNGILDLSTLVVQVDYGDVVEDPSCRRVSSVKLQYRALGGSQWTEVISMDLFRRLDNEIRDLEICQGHEVSLELQGTEGTQSDLVSLGQIERPSAEKIQEALDSGFEYHPARPTHLTLAESHPNSSSLQWSMSGQCFTAVKYSLTGVKDNQVVAEGELSPPSPDSSTNGNPSEGLTLMMTSSFEDLAPCTDYRLVLESYFTVEPELILKTQAELAWSTPPEFTRDTQFSLNTLKNRRVGSLVSLTWSRDEWPCLRPQNYHVWLCPSSPSDSLGSSSSTSPDLWSDASASSSSPSSCLGANEENTARVTQISGRLVVKFQDLDTCNEHKVRIVPHIEGMAAQTAIKHIPEYQDGDEIDEESPMDGSDNPWVFDTTLPLLHGLASPTNLSVQAVAATSVTLSWVADPCAISYAVTLSTQKQGELLFERSLLLALENVTVFKVTSEIGSHPQLSVPDEDISGEEHDSHEDEDSDENDENGSDSLEIDHDLEEGDFEPQARVKRQLDLEREMEYDYESFMIESGDADLKLSERIDDEDYTILDGSADMALGLSEETEQTDDEDYTNWDGSGSGWEPPLDDSHELDANSGTPQSVTVVKKEIDNLKTCHEYVIKVNNVFRVKGEERFSPAAQVTFKTLCPPTAVAPETSTTPLVTTTNVVEDDSQDTTTNSTPEIETQNPTLGTEIETTIETTTDTTTETTIDTTTETTIETTTETTTELSETTTTNHPKTTETIVTTREPLIPLQDYELTDFDNSIILAWTQARDVQSEFKVRGRDGSIKFQETILTESKGAPDYERVERRLDLDPCSSHELTLSHVQDVHGNVTEFWSKSWHTPPNPEDRFRLESTQLIVSKGQSSGRGSVVFEWIHSLDCIEHYKIRLVQESTVGETVVMPTQMGESIKVDLHMMPGILNLANCHKYTLQILPITNYELDPTSPWLQGFTKSFRYMLADDGAPNNVQDQIEVIAEDFQIHLKWPEPLSCKEMTLSVSGNRHIYNDHGHNQYIHANDIPIFSDHYVIFDVRPCFDYNLILSVDDGILLDRTVTTLPNATVIDGLSENEVAIWREDQDPTEVKLEWASRCVEAYTLSYCQYPDECSLEESLVTREVSAPASEQLPGITLTNLGHCHVYKYWLRTATDALIYEGNFTTHFGEEFSFDFPDFQTSHDNLAMSWKHHFPCIDHYDFKLSLVNHTDIWTTRISPSNASDRIELSLTEPAELGALTLRQCEDYQLTITPRLTSNYSNLPWEETSSHLDHFLHLTESILPKDIKHNADQTGMSLSWTSSPCVSSYLLSVSDSQDETLTANLTIMGNSTSLPLESLEHCTQYHLKLRSISPLGISESFVSSEFMTDHSDEIKIHPNSSYESVSMTSSLHGQDCVDHYKMFLCSVEREVCWNQSLSAENGAVAFDNLSEGSAYVYQLVGYKANGVEVYFSPENVVETRHRIKATMSEYNITERSVEFEISSSLFDSGMDARMEWWVELSCSHKDETLISKGAHKTVKFKDLDPFTMLICSGTFYTEQEEVQMESLWVKTLPAPPSAPRSLSAEMVNSTWMQVRWEVPEKIPGVLDNYVIDVHFECLNGSTECPDPDCGTQRNVSVSGGVTEWTMPVRNFRRYMLDISAQTGHVDRGPQHGKIIVDTLSGRPFPGEVMGIQKMGTDTVLVEFKAGCPTQGDAGHQVKWQCQGCKVEPRAILKIHHDNLIEISGLEGGHYYNIWIESTIKDCADVNCTAFSPSQVVYLECEYQCRDGTCINRGWNIQCDFVRDCPDGSDEVGCSCDPPYHFECANKYCIDSWRRCDGNADCNDFSDETGCPRCHDNQFQCEHTQECIPKNMTCDRMVQCRDGSDEKGCAYWTSSCWPERFRCLDHTCVDIKHRCDGIWDCVNGEDELSCNTVCDQVSEFACKNRQCIHQNLYCNGEKDCEDGTDELFECQCHTNGQFACVAGNECVARLKVCDGALDCSDGSDERGCGVKIQSLNLDLPVNIVNENIVQTADEDPINGSLMSEMNESSADDIDYEYDHMAQKDSADGYFVDYSEIKPIFEDPLSEFYDDVDFKPANQIKESSSKYKLAVYPPEQKVYEGNDVVIQCRDEGNLRAAVEWKRRHGKPLPKSASQDWGRLEIVAIRRFHYGTYVCVVQDGDEDVPGESVTSQVEIITDPARP